MKRYLILLLFFINLSAFGQFQMGFEPEEARDMMALFNSYTFMDLYGSDDAIIPKGYIKVFTSKTYALDNKFQVFTKGDCGVISVRGSTDKKPSWLENFYTSMIPASGEITLENKKYPYDLSNADSAAVHAGYVLGVTYMIDDIVTQIEKLNALGIYKVYLSGHSQGGAISQILRLYLQHHASSAISDNTIYKTYAFASPKIGNTEFVADYEKQLYNKGSFTMINPQDLVPTFPLTYSDSSIITKTEIIDRVIYGKKLKLSDRMTDGTVRIGKKPLRMGTKTLGTKSHKEIKRDVTVDMPTSVTDIDYVQMTNIITILPVDFPKVLIDSSILQNETFMNSHPPKNKEGHFIDEELYVKEPMLYQHKPYNYYVSILKMYFPKEYDTLKMKYLPESVK